MTSQKDVINSDKACRHLISQIPAGHFSNSITIIQTDPANTALQPSPASPRSSSRFYFYNREDTNSGKLSNPCCIGSRSLSDIQIRYLNLHKERYFHISIWIRLYTATNVILCQLPLLNDGAKLLHVGMRRCIASILDDLYSLSVIRAAFQSAIPKFPSILCPSKYAE